ncbi:FYVE zinc finger-domain-containing protein [Phlebopus sp. FC_14]|nr:FYVE zinc finger-domain-containing protein [Phlebopus sp. FC_14]
METASHIPYQAYRSKRHSRTVSTLPLVPNVAPPTVSRPSSVVSNGPVIVAQPSTRQSDYFDGSEKASTGYPDVVAVVSDRTEPIVDLLPATDKELPSPPSTNLSLDTSETSPDSVPSSNDSHVVAQEREPPPDDKPTNINGKITEDNSLSSDALPPSSSSTLPPVTKPATRRTTLRRIPATRSPLPSSPLRPPDSHFKARSTSSATRYFDQPQIPRSPPVHSRVTSISSTISENRPSAASSSFTTPALHSPPELPQQLPHAVPAPSPIRPQSRNAFLPASLPPTRNAVSPATSLSTTPTSPSPSTSSPPAVPVRSSVHYRPGFQPKGVYRPRTDEFAEVRKSRTSAGRIERTKLERRLEKLINLHFPMDGTDTHQMKRGMDQRRSSSLFDLDIASLRNMDAGELWKGVLQSQVLQGPKGDIRAAEQRITPWQEDSAVSKCPLCTTSFHPLTNRKHHCRLCGQIICSLPIKRPQRLEPCSILFIVDSKTRGIEEVGEGVDYGVRKKRGFDPQKKGKEKDDPFALAEDEKFLKGVRICRSCKPVLAREQYYQEVARVPLFVRLYENFISLEKEIEESIPQFQELLLTLSNDSQPTKEASAARKRLLDAFTEYDALSKRIHKIPCAPGSSQDRVQLAILTRANLFLQKNMFPLQSLPKPQKRGSSNASTPEEVPIVDPDSELAHALQPLFEQEALLESFVGEAMAHRKFEDAKTLKANLKEIRTEINRMLSSGTVNRL